jgi:hypothetical protein
MATDRDTLAILQESLETLLATLQLEMDARKGHGVDSQSYALNNLAAQVAVVTAAIAALTTLSHSPSMSPSPSRSVSPSISPSASPSVSPSPSA